VSHFISIEKLGEMPMSESEYPKRIAKFFERRNKRQDTPSRKPTYATIEEAAEARANAPMPVSLRAALILTRRGIQSVCDPTGKIAYTWRTDPALTLPSPWATTTAQSKMFLQNLKCPVLFIFGKKGYFNLEDKDIQMRLGLVKTKKIMVVRGKILWLVKCGV
jgi:hypothetical protein